MLVPKLRFKREDGMEFPEWEEKSVKECCDVFIDGDWIESKDQSKSGIRLIEVSFSLQYNMVYISMGTEEKKDYYSAVFESLDKLFQSQQYNLLFALTNYLIKNMNYHYKIFYYMMAHLEHKLQHR